MEGLKFFNVRSGFVEYLEDYEETSRQDGCKVERDTDFSIAVPHPVPFSWRGPEPEFVANGKYCSRARTKPRRAPAKMNPTKTAISRYNL